jgi:hypothetical protein
MLRDHLQIETWTKALNAVIDAAKLGIEIYRSGVSKMPFTAGLGILTKQEIASLDKNSSNKMTHVERCQKRAYMAALKQLFDLPLGGSVGVHGETMDDYIPEAEWRVLEEDEVSDAPELTEEEKEALSERAKAGADSLYGADSDEPEIIEPKSGQAGNGQAKKRTPVQWEDSTIKEARKHAYFPSNAPTPRVRATLNLSPFNEDMPFGWIEEWLDYYEHRRARNSDAELPSQLAAEAATADWRKTHAKDEDAIGAFGEEWFASQEG